MLDRTPQVFISYSWTSKEYQESIVALASRLRHDGVDVKLDVWDLKEGQDKYVFMEQCVTNPYIDKVLILSDRVYTEKADQRKGGVGDETTIISAEVYGNADQHKFIPVVMERDEEGNEYLPAYLKSRIFRDLSGSNYESEYEALLRTIFDEPSHRKPEIGERPEWLIKESPDSLYSLKDALRRIKAADLSRMKEVAACDFVDAYIEAMKQFYVKNIDKDKYLANFAAMKEYRDVFLDHLKIVSANDHFGIIMADEFEKLYNALYDIHTFDPEMMSCGENDFDLFRLHVWELFVCTVTFMLHFELYEDINELLVHTYYLRTFGLGEEKQPTSYESFRFHSKMMEEFIKPTMEGDLPRRFTLVGHFVTSQREYLPVYSAKNIANADLFLYQVYNALGLEDLTRWFAWFPTLYIYADGNASMWKHLTSRRFCDKIMPVFGVKTIEELKEKIAKCIYNREYNYSGAWPGAASAILSWIKLEDMATLP